MTEIRRPMNNYFRVGFGRTARYVFFNDNDSASIQAAWEKLGATNDRIAVWRTPMYPGPWNIECIVISGEGLYMGRSLLGPVVS